MQVVTGGFNLNWFEIGNLLVVGNEPELSRAEQAYPNPVGETLFIPNARSVRALEILTPQGETVYAGPASAQIDFTAFRLGLYILKLTSLKGSVSTQKIIKK